MVALSIPFGGTHLFMLCRVKPTMEGSGWVPHCVLCRATDGHMTPSQEGQC